MIFSGEFVNQPKTKLEPAIEASKILFIIPSLGGGGAEKVLVDLLDNFDYSRYAVSLLVIHNYGPYVGKVNKNVNVISVEKGAITFYNRVCGKILRNIGLYKYVCRKKCEKLVQSDFDVVISFTTNEAYFYHSFIMKKGKRNLSWVHIDVEKNRYSYPFSSKEEESKVYSQMDEIIFVSNDAKNAFNNVFSINVPVLGLDSILHIQPLLSGSFLFTLEGGERTLYSVPLI